MTEQKQRNPLHLIYDDTKIESWDICTVEELKKNGEWDELSEKEKKALEKADAFVNSKEGQEYITFLQSGFCSDEAKS